MKGEYLMKSIKLALTVVVAVLFVFSVVSYLQAAEKAKEAAATTTEKAGETKVEKAEQKMEEKATKADENAAKLPSGDLTAAEKKPEAKEKDVATLIMDTPSVSTFAKAVKTAELGEMLTGKASHTVLAPNDDAFKKMGAAFDAIMKDKEKLADLVKANMISGKWTFADLQKVTEVNDANGAKLAVTSKDGVVTVGGVKVPSTATMASNGALYVTDTVLMPKPKVEKPAVVKEKEKAAAVEAEKAAEEAKAKPAEAGEKATGKEKAPDQK